MMIEIVNHFIEALKNQEYLHAIIQQADFRINLAADGQVIQLVFYHGEITVEQEISDSLTRFEISGSQTAIAQLLKGKERLRLLERNGCLKIVAPLRMVLLLESIFYLTRPDHYLEKII